MRLIDANELKEHIAFHGIVGVGYSDDERVTDVLDMVDTAPTVDQTQHGQWTTYYYQHHTKRYHCSECGQLSEERTNFCSNCGADMRGGTE